MMEYQKKKILIADRAIKTEELILNSPFVDQYEFFFVKDGLQFKRSIRSIQPDLVILEILLPHHHGIELLKWMKEHHDLNTIGVIITTYELMLQNYRAAYEFGADYFLEKPFDANYLFATIEKYFAGSLEIEPFSGNKLIDFGIDSYYDPKFDPPKNYLKFWGTRGSSSVSGGDYSKFGGNTCCLEVRYGKDVVIIDSGTGIRPFGEKLAEEKIKDIHLFISHTHQDHVVGFPFFMPLYFERTHLNIYSPVGFEKHTKDLFTDMLAYSFFPVRFEQMHAQVKFIDMGDGDVVQIGNIEISACYTYHPGATLGFKIKTPKQTIGYITDNEFLVGYHGHPREVKEGQPILENYQEMMRFLKDCDIIIHEAQYFPKEYLQRVGWGHSSIVNASILFKFVKCPIWIVTHHDPRHNDQELNYKAELHRNILKESDIYTHLRYAYDGMIYPLD